jgi:hypothetical protein
MKASRCQTALLAFSVIVAGMADPCGARAQALSQEALTNFQWFSTLGFPDVKGCPLVRLADQSWSQRYATLRPGGCLTAFLLATNGKSFDVLTAQLLVEKLTASDPGAPENNRVGFEILGLREQATARLEELRGANTNDSLESLMQRMMGNFGAQLSEQGQVFVLGWACWRHGMDGLAQNLYAEAAKIPTLGGDPHKSRTFHDDLESDLGYTAMWRAVVAFGDPSVSRPDLLARCETIIANYPHSEQVQRARQTADLLKQMIAEDQEHAKTAPKDLDQLPVQERVRELIFRLRDQNGQQDMQPGWCDIFRDGHGSTSTPAHQLVALGEAAVPQLIPAVASRNFTRSVGYARDFYFSHTVLTVGDCAVTILNRITGKSWQGTDTNTQAAIQKWWDEFQTKRAEESVPVQ